MIFYFIFFIDKKFNIIQKDELWKLPNLKKLINLLKSEKNIFYKIKINFQIMWLKLLRKKSCWNSKLKFTVVLVKTLNAVFGVSFLKIFLI